MDDFKPNLSQWYHRGSLLDFVSHHVWDFVLLFGQFSYQYQSYTYIPSTINQICYKHLSEANHPKVSFMHCCKSNWSHSKNLTFLLISLYALGRFKWILDIIRPLDRHLKLKDQRNWLKQVWMLKFWSEINCIFVHWTKKLTLAITYQL